MDMMMEPEVMETTIDELNTEYFKKEQEYNSQILNSQNIRVLVPEKRPIKKQSKCYTCKPREFVSKHIIAETEHTLFQHDLKKRPLIIVTSKLHYNIITDIPADVLTSMFQDIKNFVHFWNLEGHQIQINQGTWQTNPHFHIKLKCNEKALNRMRRDHFEKKNLDKRYIPRS